MPACFGHQQQSVQCATSANLCTAVVLCVACDCRHVLLQVLQQGWSCLLCSHQHSNIRPHVQLFLLVLFSRHAAAVQELLLPALNTFNTTSYQVSQWLLCGGRMRVASDTHQAGLMLDTAAVVCMFKNCDSLALLAAVLQFGL
jgi:hypothetical protein